MVQFASSNKHFDIPQAVSSIFTGREHQLEELRAAFLSPLPEGEGRMQKRFVISGLGGSGKTQWFVLSLIILPTTFWCSTFLLECSVALFES